MNEKSLRTLEFDKVRERLARHTSFSAGRNLALGLEPSSNIDEVRRWQQETTEAVRLISLRPDATIGAAHDVREIARRAELGSLLDPPAILAVLDTLQAGRVLHDAIMRTNEQRGGLDRIAFVADGITLLPKIEQEIVRCINEDGQVLDSASPALGKIRVNIRAAHARLMSKLQQIISSDTYARALQEPIITTRDGRYVVPVKRDFQGSLRGIVHDQSNTGATLFIEPMAVVELGNEWRQLQMEEAQEIEKIMRELGNLVGSRADAIITNVEILADIDLAMAKARYSVGMNAMEPELVEVGDRGSGTGGRPRPARQEERRGNDQSMPTVPRRPTTNNQQPTTTGLYFRNARHPLLTGTVVPITVELGERFRVLVITGPNTGGKTVALKTVGLLTLMAQAGLHLPVDGGSRAVIFRDVFADIGDEQSIEQSLSTFSSHMSNIVGILKQATRDCLVLLDELGAGTDPQEGSALARSIIVHILQVGAMAVGTTHYSELKAFASTTAGVQNASVEFDVNTLSPTYRLTIGVPGRSNALAIASRLGLTHTIIDRARSFIDPQAQQVDNLLETIRKEREAARSEHGTAEQTRRDIDRKSEELDRRLREIDEIKARAAEEGRVELERELRALRDELRALRGRVEAGMVGSDAGITRQWVQEAQLRAQELDKELANKATQQQRARARRTAPAVQKLEVEAAPHTIAAGDTVFVHSLGAEGEVLSRQDKHLDVQVGAFKMRVPVEDVSLRKAAQTARREEQAAAMSSTGRYAPAAPVAPPPLEYDFRGWRAEQAIEEIDRRLDEAALSGMPFLRVIHGKGTGALRTALRDFFKKHPLVKEIETAPIEQGGEGVTIVKL